MTFQTLKARTHEIELDWPFAYGGVEYRKLELRRPTTGDLSDLVGVSGKAANAAARRLLASLANVQPEVIDGLDPEDMGKVNAWLEPIMDPNGQGSGTGGS